MCIIESLEWRQLFAAPSSIAGLSLNFTSVNGITESGRGAKWTFAANANASVSNGTLINSAGAKLGVGSYVWSYSPYTGTGTLGLMADVTVSGYGGGWGTLTFTSDTRGTYEFSAGFSATERGSFSVGGIKTPFATLSNGTLTVMGSRSDDRIAVIQDGSTFTVRRNRERLTIRGEAEWVEVYGGKGNDAVDLTRIAVRAEVQGGPGNNLLYGGPMNDMLIGGADDDTIYGGAGDDYVDALSQTRGGGTEPAVRAGSREYLDAGRGNDRVYGHGNATIIGGAGNDSLYGWDGHDVIMGGDGDDFMFARGGNDIVRGGTGNDTLRGGDGKDQIWGELGHDSLEGGTGLDWFSGGRGEDVYVDRDSREVIEWL